MSSNILENKTHHTKDLYPKHWIGLFCGHFQLSLRSCGKNFGVGARKKGSVLVYAFIILSIMLMTGIAISTTTMRTTKGAIAGDKSVQAFELADSGIEILIKDFRDSQDAATAGSSFNVINIKDVGNQSDSSCGGSACSRDQCTNGVLTINIKTISSESADKVDMNFEDLNDDPIACDGLLSDVRNIKSIGYFQGVARAIGTSL